MTLNSYIFLFIFSIVKLSFALHPIRSHSKKTAWKPHHFFPPADQTIPCFVGVSNTDPHWFGSYHPHYCQWIVISDHFSMASSLPDLCHFLRLPNLQHPTLSHFCTDSYHSLPFPWSVSSTFTSCCMIASPPVIWSILGCPKGVGKDSTDIRGLLIQVHGIYIQVYECVITIWR